MKILIVGSNQVYAIENFYIKHLRELGADVQMFPSTNIFYDYYQKNILNRIIFKSGLSPVYKAINEEFKQMVERYVPELIWVFKGMEMLPASLQWVREQKIKLINYNPDNPFIFSGKRSGNSNVSDSITLYDLHLTYHMGVKKKLEEDLGLPAAILPFGFDNDETLYRQCLDQKEVIKLCFLGNPDKKRSAFLNALADNGINIDVFGNHWNKFIHHSNISVFSPAYGIEQWKILRRYRTQLNLMRVHNRDSHNMRSFEVPGIGGIMIAPDTIEHRMYFNDGKEVFLFNGINDCVEIIKELLHWNQAKADEIRLAARKRSIVSGYSYNERAKQALEHINNFLPGEIRLT